MTHTIELRGVWHHTHQRNASLAPGALIDRFYPRVLEALSQCLDQLRTHALDQWYSLYAHVNDYESQLKQLQDAHASDAVLDDQLDNEGRVVRQCVIATLATLAAYFVSIAISAADVPYDDTTIQSVILNDGSPLTYDEQLGMLGDRPNLQCTFRRCSSLIREAQSANPDLVEIIPALSHISLHDQQAKLAGVEYLVDTLVYFSKETN